MKPWFPPLPAPKKEVIDIVSWSHHCNPLVSLWKLGILTITFCHGLWKIQGENSGTLYFGNENFMLSK